MTINEIGWYTIRYIYSVLYDFLQVYSIYWIKPKYFQSKFLKCTFATLEIFSEKLFLSSNERQVKSIWQYFQLIWTLSKDFIKDSAKLIPFMSPLTHEPVMRFQLFPLNLQGLPKISFTFYEFQLFLGIRNGTSYALNKPIS